MRYFGTLVFRLFTGMENVKKLTNYKKLPETKNFSIYTLYFLGKLGKITMLIKK